MSTARYALISSIAGLVALLVTPLGAYALPAQSITISPTTVDKTLAAGSVLTGSEQVINTGSEGFDFKIYATPYSVTGQEYQQHFTALPGKPDITSWFSFARTTAHADSNQMIEVPYTIDVPAATPPGDYYATVFAETQPAAAPTNGVVLHQRVGTIFYLQVGGQVVKHGSLDAWQASFLQVQQVRATLKLKNDGDAHFVATSQVVVRDAFGTPKYTLSTAREILPKTIRQIDVSWPTAPPLGLFKLSGTVTILGQSYTLPTRYVLVASWPVRWLTLAIIIAILIWVGARHIRHAKPKV